LTVSSGTELHFRCAAFPNGCTSELILRAPPDARLPPGQPGTAEYLQRLDWFLVHELDGRVAAQLRGYGWHLAYGKWVCGLRHVR
jgi:hypothetical protein